MAGTWASSWGTSWGTSWERESAEEEVEVYVPRGSGLSIRRRGRRLRLYPEFETQEAKEAAEQAETEKKKRKTAKKPLIGDLSKELPKQAIPQPDAMLTPAGVEAVERGMEILRLKEEEELMMVLALAA